MPKRGKKYLESVKKVEHDRLYTPEDAVKLVKETSYTKFDGTIETHIRLGVDPRKADQLVRGTVSLPNGTGKSVRVLVLAESEGVQLALDAGADFAGLDDMIAKIQDGWFEFDVTVAVSQVMSKVGRLGRLLGPRGLMPSPKAGTVVAVDDIPRVVKELKAGRIEFRLDRTANIHVPIGRASFSEAALNENFSALMESIMIARPAAAKGQYVRGVSLAATMGPGVRVDPHQAMLLRTPK
jgi:large subunit ribosomal protein L1